MGSAVAVLAACASAVRGLFLDRFVGACRFGAGRWLLHLALHRAHERGREMPGLDWASGFLGSLGGYLYRLGHA